MGLHTNWVEMFSGFLLVLGFIFGVSVINSKFMFFVIIFMWGMLFGRVWYKARKDFRFHWVCIQSLKWTMYVQ